MNMLPMMIMWIINVRRSDAVIVMQSRGEDLCGRLSVDGAQASVGISSVDATVGSLGFLSDFVEFPSVGVPLYTLIIVEKFFVWNFVDSE